MKIVVQLYRRNPIKIPVFIISILLTGTILFSQRMIRITDKQTGEPVKDVLIEGTDIAIYSDDKGRFDLNYFTDSDTLKFSHLNFVTVKIPLRDLMNKEELYLLPKEILTEEVRVTDSQSGRPEGNPSEVILISEEARNLYANTGEVLAAKSSLFIKDYGGGAGLKTVSSRGLSSENTLVLFNEARVNDLRTGSFDFSVLSSVAADRIEFFKSGSTESFLFSPGGVIKLYSGNLYNDNRKIIGIKASSDGMNQIYAKLNHYVDDLSFSLIFDRAYSSNQYEYEFEGKDLKRMNSHFSKTFLSGSITHKLPNNVLNLYSHYSYLTNGIPGYVVTNNTNSSSAYNKAVNFLSIINDEFQIGNDFFWRSTLSYNIQRLKLNDPENMLLLNSEESDTDLKDFNLRTKLEFEKETINISGGYELASGRLKGSGVSISPSNDEISFTRDHHRFFGAVSYSEFEFLGAVSRIRITGRGAYEIISERLESNRLTNNFSYSLGLSAEFSEERNITFNFNFFNDHRNPTFNERYYSSLYSDDPVNPERHEGFDAGLSAEFESLGPFEIGLTFFRIRGIDKIVWIPTRLALQIPRNYSNTMSTGLEFFLSKKISNIFELEIFYNYTDTRNRSALSAEDNSYDKRLVYSPLHRLKINPRLRIERFEISLFTGFVSKRYYTNDNSEENSLPSYFIADLLFQYKFDLFGFGNTVSLSALNLLNENYLIIQSYPMPLRTFIFGYAFEF